MASTKLTIDIDVDSAGAVQGVHRVTGAVRDLDQTSDRAQRSGHALGRAGTAIKLGMIGAAVGAAKFGVDAVKAFNDAEQQMTRATTSLDRNNSGWRKHKGEIDRVITAHMNLGAFDDEQLYVSFANLARVTGNTTEALRLQETAMDLARGKGISLEAATNAVMKAHEGQTGALRRLGVQMGKHASGTEAIAAAQRQFAGQAEAYGNTSAGQAERLGVAWGNFQETIGSALAPAISFLAQKFNEAMPTIQAAAQHVVDWIREHWPEISAAFRAMWDAVVQVVDALKPYLQLLWDIFKAVAGWIKEHWPEISAVISAVFAVIKQYMETMATVIRTAFEVAVAAVEGFITAIQAVVSGVSTAAEAIWDAVKTAVTAPIDFARWLYDNIVAPIGNFFATAAQKGADIARKIWSGFTSFATDVAGWINNRIIQPIVNAYTGILEKGGAIARHIWQGFVSVVTDMVGWIRSRVIEPVTNRIEAIFSKGADMAGAVWDGFKSFLTDMTLWVRDHIIAPIGERLAAIASKGGEIAGAIAQGITDGMGAAWRAVSNAVKGFLNQIIRIINKIPLLPDIPELAHGGTVASPTLAVIGEDGPEFVIPVGAKRRKRGLQLLQAAAAALGVEGDVGLPSASAVSAMRRAGIPMLADGYDPYAYGSGDISALMYGQLLAQQTPSVWSEVGAFFARGAAAVINSIPMPSFGGWFGNLAVNIRDGVADGIRGLFSHRDQFDVAKIGSAYTWADSKMGGTYVYGANHGGFNLGDSRYDCSSFAFTAAHVAGSTTGMGSTVTADGFRNADRNEPMFFGVRGSASGGRNAHMGVKILGDWFQFGPRKGGSDSMWTRWKAIPGLPGYATGTDYVPRTGPAVLHVGEAVLNRADAAAYRAGRGNVTVVLESGMEWLARYLRVEMDGYTRDARRLAMAGGRA